MIDHNVFCSVAVKLSRPSKTGYEACASMKLTKKIGEMAFPGIEEEIRLLHLFLMKSQ
jgi:hypothetical protein